MMKPNHLLVVLLSLFFVACSVAPETPNPKSATLDNKSQLIGNIDTVGGKVCSEGGVCFQFTEGSVDKKTELFGRVDKDSDSSVVGKIYEFTAAKETFNNYLSLTLPVPSGLEDSELDVVFWKDGAWVAVPTTVGADGKTRIGSTNHLSRWSLAKKKASGQCRSTADCARGQTCVGGSCKSQPAGCGRRGVTCARGEVCVSGVCKSHPSGCGSRGTTCARGEVCVAGICEKQPTPCRTSADCSRGQVCSRGQCGTAPTSCSEGMTRSCGTGPSGVGPCQKGKQTCRRGVWGACQGEVKPSKEICNRIDDDCDGVIDENCSSNRCSSHSDCARGETCVSGSCKQQPTSCRSSAGCSRGEVCVSGVCKSHPAGCGSRGTTCARGEVCVAGTCKQQSTGCSTDADCARGQVCQRGQCATPPPSCKDGESKACGIAAGVCSQGKQVCSRGVWSACQGEVKPLVELCNGLDDDCDGTVDEANSTMCTRGQVCQRGQCVTSGSLPCRSDSDCASRQVCYNGHCK